MKSDYIPVSPEYHDLFFEEQKKSTGRALYFDKSDKIEDLKGKIVDIDKSTFEKYLVFDSGVKVRFDRIIVLNGKPGPAYDKYDSYALACLDCNVQSD